MNEEELDRKIREEIDRTRDAKFGFNDAESIQKFELRIEYLKDPSNHLSVKEMLGPKKGHAAARKILKKQQDIDGNKFLQATTHNNEVVEPEDVKGVYVWFCDLENPKAFYVGIGGKIINRLYQHVKYPNHNSASMAFKIARLAYGIEMDEKGRPKTRGEYDPQNTANVQEWLLKQKVAICEITNDDELAAFEIFCAIKLDTVLNTFETH